VVFFLFTSTGSEKELNSTVRVKTSARIFSQADFPDFRRLANRIYFIKLADFQFRRLSFPTDNYQPDLRKSPSPHEEKKCTDLAGVAEAGEPESLPAEEENGIVQQVQPHIDQPHHLSRNSL
jgi:hypothetical protein